MAITAADISVEVNGDIRWEASGAGDGPYTVLELHRYLQDLADDDEATGDDLLDITSSTPSERSTDNIITLLGNFNVDGEMVEHLYDGSITQAAGDEVYSGLVVVGSVNLPTTLQIVQDGLLYNDGVHDPTFPFWEFDLNSDAANNILIRCMVLTRTGGSDIDGKRIRIQAREVGDTYAEFSVTMGLGNSTAAIFTNADLNNTTAVATIAGWSTIENDNEGWNELDLDNGAGNREYYSKWDRGSQTINELYERAKWLQRNPGTKFTLDGNHTGVSQTSILIEEDIPADTPSTGFIRVERDSGVYSDIEYTSWTSKTFTIVSTDFDADNASDQNTVVVTYNALTLSAALTTGAVTSVVCNEDIPTGLPSTGNIRIQRASGAYTVIAYTSYTSKTFTIGSTDFSTDNAPDNGKVIIAYDDLYGLGGYTFRGITHQVEVTNPSGTWDAFEPVSWTGGTGQMLAIDHATAPNTMWIQLLTGVAPSGSLTITGASSSADADTNTTVTSRTLSPCFLGQSTGTALIGAYGIGVEVLDLSQNDKVFDLTNTQQIPPNMVTFTVSGLVSGQDYVLVTNDQSSDIDYDQLSKDGDENGTGVTSIVCVEDIPADTPATGTATNSAIRIQLEDGTYKKVEYTSWTSKTFTIPSTDFDSVSKGIDNGANIFIAYIDVAADGTEEAFTTKYSSPRTLFVRVRDGGASPIKTFESPSALGSAGGAATAIRTTDA